jgi:hypothetical protein
MQDSITGTISMSRRKGGVFHHPANIMLLSQPDTRWQRAVSSIAAPSGAAFALYR